MRTRDGAAQPADQENLQRIRVAADRILKFCRDLVHYARPAREAPGPVTLPEVVAQAQTFSQHEFERYGIEMDLVCPEELPTIVGRAGPLTQVFVNLFTNAAHAMSVSRRPALRTIPTRGRYDGGGSNGYGHRHPARDARPHLRTVLHHQGERARDGPRPLDRTRDYRSPRGGRSGPRARPGRARRSSSTSRYRDNPEVSIRAGPSMLAAGEPARWI